MAEKTEIDVGTQTEEVESTTSTERKKRQFVSPHPDGGWQVKIEGGKKATKRFATKLEAEHMRRNWRRTRVRPSCVRRRMVSYRRNVIDPSHFLVF